MPKLRAPAGATIYLVDGEHVVPKVHAVIEKVAGFACRADTSFRQQQIT